MREKESFVSAFRGDEDVLDSLLIELSQPLMLACHETLAWRNGRLYSFSSVISWHFRIHLAFLALGCGLSLEKEGEVVSSSLLFTGAMAWLWYLDTFPDARLLLLPITRTTPRLLCPKIALIPEARRAFAFHIRFCLLAAAPGSDMFTWLSIIHHPGEPWLGARFSSILRAHFRRSATRALVGGEVMRFGGDGRRGCFMFAFVRWRGRARRAVAWLWFLDTIP